jgi:C1A family cysteine protease
MGDVFDIAAEECVESLNAIKTKKLVSLSIAQIEDCCGTQSLIDPFQCINRKIGGLCLTQDYPTPKGSCDAKSCKPVAPVSGSYHIKSGNETDLQLALLQAPVFVAVDASQPSFLMYSGGVYGDPQCSSTQIDHVLQLVGYGVQDGTPFWICRNSWGASWGENGKSLEENPLKNAKTHVPFRIHSHGSWKEYVWHCHVRTLASMKLS